MKNIRSNPRSVAFVALALVLISALPFLGLGGLLRDFSSSNNNNNSNNQQQQQQQKRADGFFLDNHWTDLELAAESMPSTTTVKSAATVREWHHRACAQDQVSESYCGVVETFVGQHTPKWAKRHAKKETDTAGHLHFACPDADAPGDFVHCRPATYASMYDEAEEPFVANIDVPNLDQHVTRTRRGREWARTIRAANVSRLPNPYSQCRIAALHDDSGATTEAQESYNRLLPPDEEGAGGAAAARARARKRSAVPSSAFNVSLVRFIMPPAPTSAGPFGCRLPAYVTVAWTPTLQSTVHGRNHIVVRLGAPPQPMLPPPWEKSTSGGASTPGTGGARGPRGGILGRNYRDASTKQRCRVSVQAFSVDIPGSVNRVCGERSSTRFFPPVYRPVAPQSKKATEVLTYSIEAAGVSSLDLFVASPAKCKPKTYSLYSNEQRLRFCSGSRVPDDVEVLRALNETRTILQQQHQQQHQQQQQQQQTSAPDEQDRDDDEVGARDGDDDENDDGAKKTSNKKRRKARRPPPAPPMTTAEMPRHNEEIDLLSQAAALRCDLGQYQGYTNVLQSFVVCAVLAKKCGRPVVEFPLKFHHGVFSDLLDLPLVQARMRSRFGIELRLVGPETLDAGGGVSATLHVHDKPKHPKLLHAFLAHCTRRPWATVFVGDIWPTRMNVAAAKVHTMFMSEIFASSSWVLRFARPIVFQMGAPPSRSVAELRKTMREFDQRDFEQPAARATAAGAAEGSTARAPSSSSATTRKWLALHLRFEDDAIRLSNKRANAGATAARARKICKHIEDMFPGRRVYLAAGALSSEISSELPLLSTTKRMKMSVDRGGGGGGGAGWWQESENEQQQQQWITKDDFFLRKPWKKTYLGRYFNGQPVNITNATGSAIDMHVLINAPVAIVAEFSSFGEVIAATRCARGLPVFMYDVGINIFSVNCKETILFRRNLNEAIRSAESSIRAQYVDVQLDRNFAVSP